MTCRRRLERVAAAYWDGRTRRWHGVSITSSSKPFRGDMTLVVTGLGSPLYLYVALNVGWNSQEPVI